MSLHKVKKSRCWHLAFRDETGKRTLRSTGESVLRRAKIKADAMLRIAEDARAGLTDRRFLLRTVDDTLRRLGHTIDEPTLWQFLNQWLSDIKAQVSEITYDRYSVVVRLFSDSVGFKKLTDVNSADFVRFRDKMLAEGRSAATVNLMLRG